MNRVGLPKNDNLTQTRAKRKHDQLIAMGGRPTRPVKLQPSWNAVYRHGLIYLYDHEGELEGTLLEEEDPMSHHWQNELANFKTEISLWQRFRCHQKELLRLGRLDTELELDHTNTGLVKTLTRLSDWEEFEVFWNNKHVDALRSQEASRSYFLRAIESEAQGEESSSSSEVHKVIRNGLRQFNEAQKEVKFTQAWMDWAKGEWPKLIAESVDAISKTPELQPVLEARFRKQTRATFSALQKLGGQPSHAVSPPDESMDSLHRILYWSSETAIYRQELGDWRKFLKWRAHQTTAKSTIERKGGQYPRFRPASESFGEIEKFRRCQYDFALSWVGCWQRIVRWYEEEIDTPNPNYQHYTLDDLQRYAEVARSRVIESEQKLANAARQLEKSAQEHARVLSEHVSFSDSETRIEGQQGAVLPTPPPSNSGSSRTSRSSASSCSDGSRSSRSPRSSRSSLSSKSSRSSQSSQSAGFPSKDWNPRMQISSSQKAERRSKKMDIRRSRAKIANLDANAEHRAARKISPGPQQAIIDDDIKMTDALEDPGAVGGTEIKDSDMTDRHDAIDYNTLFSSESLSSPSTKIQAKKSAISSGNGVTTRKTSSLSRPDHTVLGRIPKNVGKKPTKKAKKFTEQQAIILLDAVSGKSSALESPPLRRSDRLKESVASNGNDVDKKPTKKATEHQDTTHINAASSNAARLESAPLRRSDRLKEKASASAVTPPSHPNPSPTLQPPEQLKRKSATVKSPRPSRQKKLKTQPDAPEPLQDSTHKSSKKQAIIIEQSRSRRQKKLEKRARSAVHPG